MTEPSDQLQKLTECCICFHAFTDPRMLPCIHTFCLECLKQTGATVRKVSGENMPCPLCRKVFIIPAEGMNGLQKNFFMQHLMDVTTMIQLGQKPVTDCDMCIALHEGDEEKRKEATMRCLECGENFCYMCSKTHKLHKLSKGHNIVKIGSETEEDIIKMQPLRNCTDHNGKPLDLYCMDCKKIICVACFVEKHATHKCQDVTSVHKEFRETIEKSATKISNCAEQIITKGRMVDQRKTEVFLNLADAEDKIRKRNLELKEIIDSHTNTLLEELSLIKQRHVKDFANEREDFERIHTILKSFETYCSEFRSKGSASDVCSCVGELIARAAELKKESEEFIDRPFQKAEVSFNATDLEELLKTSRRNIVGHIQERTSQFENCVVIVGLDDAWKATSDVFKVNLRRPNEILTQQQIPTTIRNQAVGVVYSNTLYVTGIGDNADEIWKYSSDCIWMKCSSLVQRRGSHSAAFINEVMYICGGCTFPNRRVLDSVEAYNAVSNKCKTVGKLVHCVQNAGNCVPFKSSLYIFGGTDEDNHFINKVQMYDTKQNVSTLLRKPMPHSVNLMQAVHWETSVILLGWDTCFVFNFETETLYERQQFKTDVVHFGLALEKERVFVIGGGINETDEDGRNTLWTYRDDIRYVQLQDVIDDDKPVEWKIHAKLAKPGFINVCGKIKFPCSMPVLPKLWSVERCRSTSPQLPVRKVNQEAKQKRR